MEEEIISLPEIRLEWTEWYTWEDIYMPAWESDLDIPPKPGVYEVKSIDNDEILLIAGTNNIKNRIKYALTHGTRKHFSGERIKTNEDISKMTIRWAETIFPYCAEEILIRLHVEKFHKLPKYINRLTRYRSLFKDKIKEIERIYRREKEPEVSPKEIKWSEWIDWNRYKVNVRRGGVIVPKESGVFEIRYKNSEELLLIDKSSNLRNKIRFALIKGTAVCSLGKKIRSNEDTDNLEVRWALTKSPIYVKKALVREYQERYGNYPKYVRWTMYRKIEM